MAQGLIRTRTGPGGGPLVKEVTEVRRTRALANYFFYTEIGIPTSYDLRRALETVLAASLPGNICRRRRSRARGASDEHLRDPSRKRNRGGRKRRRLAETRLPRASRLVLAKTRSLRGSVRHSREPF